MISQVKDSVGEVRASKFADFAVLASVLSISTFSLGIADPFVISISTLAIAAIALAAIIVTGRLRVDGTIYAAAFYLFTISVATLLALDHGAELGSFLRGGVWFLVFLLLYDSFCRCDYSKILRPILIFSTVLAIIHLIQLAQTYFGMEPFRMVPDSWHYSGEVRWSEDKAVARPAVIFTEVAWYAYYQIIVLSLAMIWAPLKLTRTAGVQIGMIFFSIIWSGSLAGIVLSISVLAVWLVKQRRLGRWQLAVIAFMVTAVIVFILLSPAGQLTVSRLLLDRQGSSIEIRTIYPWIRAAAVMGQWPLEGVGLGNEARAGMGTVPVLLPQINNLFAHFLAATGLIGTSGLMGFLIFIGRKHLIELLFFILLGFVSAHGLGENFWIPILLWAGSITNREMALRKSFVGAEAGYSSNRFTPARE